MNASETLRGIIFRSRCPICKRRALEGRMSFATCEAMQVDPHPPRIAERWTEWSLDAYEAMQAGHYPPGIVKRWMECIYCGARFRKDHYWKGALHAVSDQEWEKHVMPKREN